MSKTFTKKTKKTSPSDNFALRRPKVASTEWLELWKGEKKFRCIRCGMRRVYSRAPREFHGLKWVRENSEASLEKHVHGGTTNNEFSMWGRCVP